ncbi:hypothetical protein GCM10007862_32860 [Dyella lipolytica]|uniref:DUF155 domain-containing protein n=1 Tax=Dyella lipolytica TaxID=1867835 RepID=A0ABW8IWU6_9GAMM|nr:hypothetical protein [Dyella lipolytica]GLQ48235.1 hypothetical protein GCM10007862_32860 [Dyella lipolytica]
MNAHAITVRSGELVALRLFDIAYSIDLARSEILWAAHVGGAISRTSLSSTPTKAIAFDIPPLRLSLGKTTLRLGSQEVAAEISVRLYDFGVAALAVRVAVADIAWGAFVTQFNALDQAVGPNAPEEFWTALLDRVRAVILPALDRPASDTRLQEDYLLGVVHALNEPLNAAALSEQVDLHGLLSGETRQLSTASRRDLLARSYSYYADDLVVLTWDRAFIYEPRGDSDVADVIEVANAQLVEFRYYDTLLDDELPRMYDRVETARRLVSLLASRRFAHLARHLYTLVAEVTQLTEKVDNALQVTEDVYLARVYSAALELFKVPTLSASVDRKLAIIRDTYAALYAEASSRRAELLEITIVVLIILEIAVTMVLHH